jgi:phage virion morphogenesis protein
MATSGITVSGTRGVKQRIRGIKVRASNAERAWPSVGAYLSRTANKQFTTEGAYLGKPWKPLKPSYRLWKIRNGYSRKILVQTGDMKRSFTKRPMAVEEYAPGFAIFGSDNQKAVWHHNGTRRNGKRVNPPRPILYVTPQVRKDIRDILAKHVAGRSRKRT